jgi:hypothetical protein
MYELATDWTATVYSGMTLKWDYKKRTCDISIGGDRLDYSGDVAT